MRPAERLERPEKRPPPPPPPPMRKEHETTDEFYRRLFLTPLESASARETDQVKRTRSVLDVVDQSCTFEPEIQPRSRRLLRQRSPGQRDAYIRELIDRNTQKLRERDKAEANARSARLDPLDVVTNDCTFSPVVQGRRYRRPRPPPVDGGVTTSLSGSVVSRRVPGTTSATRQRGGAEDFQPVMYTPAYSMSRGEDAILAQLSQLSQAPQGAWGARDQRGPREFPGSHDSYESYGFSPAAFSGDSRLSLL